MSEIKHNESGLTWQCDIVSVSFDYSTGHEQVEVTLTVPDVRYTEQIRKWFLDGDRFSLLNVESEFLKMLHNQQFIVDYGGGFTDWNVPAIQAPKVSLEITLMLVPERMPNA